MVNPKVRPDLLLKVAMKGTRRMSLSLGVELDALPAAAAKINTTS